MIKKDIAVLASWTVQKDVNNIYYILYTHLVYLEYITQNFNKVYLISTVKPINKLDKLTKLDFDNLEVVELPYAGSLLRSQFHCSKYYNAVKNLSPKVDLFYCRVPDPFCWMPRLLFKQKTIMHFVGDPIDVAKTNPNFNWLKKKLLITLFYPEYLLYLWACKGATVFANGFHLADRLKKQGITATPLVSSTLKETDFYFDENKAINQLNPKLIYVGYLRKAKGVETVINAFSLILHSFPEAELSIVGSGDFEEELKQIVRNKNIRNVTFLGHIDQREKLNYLLRTHDIFCFASLSEGSPRVILEAMANGLNVISTPVGALPHIFTENEHIFYAGFNSPEMFRAKLEELIFNPEIAQIIRAKAYTKVQNFTIQKFLKTIFSES